jgi:F-type H+-transporting ATPase subunit b
MLIDWFTVVAQAVNFLILVWLLKRFLYRPILDAIDARERRIAAEIAEAATARAEAEKAREAFRQRNEAFDRQRAALMNDAAKAAENERQRLLAGARADSEALRARWKEALRNEHRSLAREITLRTGGEVFAIARKTLADLASISVEERLGEVFTRRLRELDGPTKQVFAQALHAAAGPVLVRSAFDLPDAQRDSIQNALNETFATEVPLRFETAADLISGIELVADGQKVAWSIAEYLMTLERRVGELLDEEAGPDAPSSA